MENELNAQFVCAYNEVNEDDIENEKKIIKKYNKEDDTLS